MTARVVALACLAACLSGDAVITQSSGSRVLIVTDRREPMAVLAAGLQAAGDLRSEIVAQSALPTDLEPYRAVIVGLNGGITERTSRALQAYTTAGRKLIVMHRSIAPNQPAEWLAFLGVRAVSADAARGGFRTLSSVAVELVALSHRSPIIENKVVYDRAVIYTSTSRPREMRLPGLAVPSTIVFLNQTPTRLKRPLLGLKVVDARSGVAYMQDTAAWVEELDSGVIYYFMIGDRITDFEVKPYVQMIANAVVD
jgi:hypothetical protein